MQSRKVGLAQEPFLGAWRAGFLLPSSFSPPYCSSEAWDRTAFGTPRSKSQIQLPCQAI